MLKFFCNLTGCAGREVSKRVFDAHRRLDRSAQARKHLEASERVLKDQDEALSASSSLPPSRYQAQSWFFGMFVSLISHTSYLTKISVQLFFYFRFNHSVRRLGNLQIVNNHSTCYSCLCTFFYYTLSTYCQLFSSSPCRLYIYCISSSDKANLYPFMVFKLSSSIF